ncbi:MAG: cyclodeaminase/cyclohydrolase family protein, partial [Duncaniella sp.]|nr:cyclodeaminase/cyclohydrolase family protein [Duncaniella sp.]
RAADARGIRVTGTEIVGLVPKRTLLEAGRYFLHKQQRSTGLPESEIIRFAIKSMGLDELAPFNPEEKVIEYLIAPKDGGKSLTAMTCTEFAYETASESPAPGGGSISAYMGALAAALGTMVANLSSHKAGWDERWKEFSDQADQGQELVERLLHLVDEDTKAFNLIMDAFKMPKSTDEEKAARAEAIEAATLYATEIPLATMEAAAATMPLLQSMASTGNPASVSDAGVGALAARSAVLGAQLNVRINAAQLKDRAKAQELLDRAAAIAAGAVEAEAAVLATVNEVLAR